MAKQRKRGQGEGSIYKRKDGLWVAAVNLGYKDGKLHRKYYYGKTRTEVSDKLTGDLAKHNQGIPIVTARQTLKQFLASWLEDSVKPSVRPATYVSYETQIRVHIEPGLGHFQLTKLEPQHIQHYMNNKLKPVKSENGELEPGLSPKTVRYHRSILAMALKLALKWNLVSRNVAELVDPPTAQKFKVPSIDVEQARILLAAIKGDRMEALFSVALSLGLRRGEALGLRWQDVDFEARTLRVNQSLARINKGLVLSQPKTEKSKRVLRLPESLAVKLREHRTRQLEERMGAGAKWVDSGLVFTTRIGTPIDPRKVKRRLDAIITNASLPHFRVHDLRHFCATLLFAQGAPLKVVSEMLGHAQIGITADIYTEVIPKVIEQQVDLMDSILTGAK
jgi:integrase